MQYFIVKNLNGKFLQGQFLQGFIFTDEFHRNEKSNFLIISIFEFVIVSNDLKKVVQLNTKRKFRSKPIDKFTNRKITVLSE